MTMLEPVEAKRRPLGLFVMLVGLMLSGAGCNAAPTATDEHAPSGQSVV